MALDQAFNLRTKPNDWSAEIIVISSQVPHLASVSRVEFCKVRGMKHRVKVKTLPTCEDVTDGSRCWCALVVYVQLRLRSESTRGRDKLMLQFFMFKNPIIGNIVISYLNVCNMGSVKLNGNTSFQRHDAHESVWCNWARNSESVMDIPRSCMMA